MQLVTAVNAQRSRSKDWFTLQPGQSLWDTRPVKRTLRLVDGAKGRVLADRYRLGRLVHDGALSATYEAYDAEADRQVTIELITRPLGAGLPHDVRLAREAQRVVGLRAPGLRVVHSVGIDGGMPFIVAAPVTGETLRDRLTRTGRMPVEECLAIALTVIDAIAAGHAAGLVHANLKPEKIRLVAGPSGKPAATVMGFGVTTLLATMNGVDTRGVGTPPYLAPEQLTGFGTSDELTDVWGVGLLVFEMIAGERAFDGSSTEEIGRQIAQGGPVRFRQLPPDVPLALERIVGAALARRPTERLSLRDLRRALIDLRAECAAASSARPPKLTVLVDSSDPCDDAECSTDLHIAIDCSDPCDDAEPATDLHIAIETDLGSL